MAGNLDMTIHYEHFYELYEQFYELYEHFCELFDSHYAERTPLLPAKSTEQNNYFWFFFLWKKNILTFWKKS